MKNFIATGETYSSRKELRDLGWTWDPEQKVWFLPYGRYVWDSEEVREAQRLPGVKVDLVEIESIKADAEDDVDTDLFM